MLYTLNQKNQSSNMIDFDGTQEVYYKTSFNGKFINREKEEVTLQLSDELIQPMYVGTIPGWIGAAISVASFITDKKNERKTVEWQNKVISHLSRIENKLDSVLAGIRAIPGMVGNLLDKKRSENYRQLLLNVVESYRDDMCGFSDAEFAVRRTELLLNELRKASYIIRNTGDSSFSFVGIAMLTEHELLYYNKTPIAAQKNRMKRYYDYFCNAITNFESALRQCVDDCSYIRELMYYHAHDNLPGIGYVDIEKYMISQKCMNYILQTRAKIIESSWDKPVKCNRDDFVAEVVGYHEVCDPDAGGDRDLYSNNVKNGNIVARKGHCAGIAGKHCSQIFGIYDKFMRDVINPYNDQHIKWASDLNIAELNWHMCNEALKASKELMKLAKKLYENPLECLPINE